MLNKLPSQLYAHVLEIFFEVDNYGYMSISEDADLQTSKARRVQDGDVVVAVPDRPTGGGRTLW